MKLLDGVYKFLFPFAIRGFAQDRLGVVLLHHEVVGIVFVKSAQNITSQNGLVKFAIQLCSVCVRLGCSAHALFDAGRRRRVSERATPKRAILAMYWKSNRAHR